MSIFPFQLIPEGSKIILYGAGNLGKEFYLQIHLLGMQKKYYHLVAWCDKSFDGYEVAAPFEHVSNILSYDFDYIVIAIRDEHTANSVKQMLLSWGVDLAKIIWTKSYFINPDFFSQNKVLALRNFDFYMDMLDEYHSANVLYGEDRFYQSYEELGIKGRRSSGDRIALYHIRDYLTREDTCLDIGCNCGFLAMQIAPYVKEITGYDIEQAYINIANKVKKFMKIDNANFYCEDFVSLEHRERYNAIFSFAVHIPLMQYGITKQSFVDLLYSSLLPNGFLFFESNYNDYRLYSELLSMFTSKNMDIRLYQNYVMDHDRIIAVLQKK